MSFYAGEGNRNTLRESFQASLPKDFHLLPAKEQMTVIFSQLANVDISYLSLPTRQMVQISPDNFNRTVWYGNTID